VCVRERGGVSVNLIHHNINVCIHIPKIDVYVYVCIPYWRYGYYRRQIPPGPRARRVGGHVCGTRYRTICMYIYMCV